MNEASPNRVAQPFRLGINYWPARTAMAFWDKFDAGEVAADFGRIRAAGFDSVRIFLTWEDFQPTARTVDARVLARLVIVMNHAQQHGLAVMPTLFTGHMSGVNWIPAWALGEGGGDTRFRVVTAKRAHHAGLANWYNDPAIRTAQQTLATQVAGALHGHAALWAWDFGNENSNCVMPPDRESGRAWLLRLRDAVRGEDEHTPITLGLHMEDLEQDRKIGPREAAEACEFLTMHGYPGYASWTSGPTDERLLPFLTRLTRWLGGGAPVLFSEFGVPTQKERAECNALDEDAKGPALVSEPDAAAYVARALPALLHAGSTGAMLWCHADYYESLWTQPPLDLATHERSFGLWRADASPKPAVAAVAKFAEARHEVSTASIVHDEAWIDLDPTTFYEAPGVQLPRLYGRYCTAARG